MFNPDVVKEDQRKARQATAKRVANAASMDELKALLRDCDNRLREHGDTTLHPLRERIYRAIGAPTVNK